MSIDWCHRDICLGKSGIHGQGYFTQKDLSKGTVVFIFGGTPFFQNQKELYEKSVQEQYSFYRSVIHLSGNFYLKASDNFHKPVKSRLINHSCEPNLVIEGHIVVRTFRDVLVGEELCLDYSTICYPEDESERVILEKCSCQTAICRKQITSWDWKNPSLQKKYGMHFSFDILKKMSLYQSGLSFEF